MEVCEKCEKKFSNSESLKQHSEDKHSNKQITNVSKNNSFFGTAAVIAISIMILVLGFALLPSASPSDENILDIYRAHTNESLHIHPTLSINVLGEDRIVNADIGVAGQGRYKVIHTHDSSGVLHIEPPYPKDITLGDFFTIWGRTFNSTCILDKCVDENHELKVYVNDEETDLYENVILNDLDKIDIIYSVKE